MEEIPTRHGLAEFAARQSALNLTGEIESSLRSHCYDSAVAESFVATLEIAAAAREVLAGHERAAVRGHAKHAVVVRFEDAWAERGCDVRAQWECVVPNPAG